MLKRKDQLAFRFKAIGSAMLSMYLKIVSLAHWRIWITLRHDQSLSKMPSHLYIESQALNEIFRRVKVIDIEDRCTWARFRVSIVSICG